MSHLLIVDSDQNLRADICNFFRGIGQVIEEAPDYPTALKMIEAVAFDIIISDVIIQGGTIRDLIKAIHSKNNNTLIIVDSDLNSVQEGVRAVKEGAFGILQKPFSIPELNFHIKRAVENKKQKKELEKIPERHRNIYQPYNFIGESPEIKEVFRIVDKVAKGNSSVILTGETGTGKELVAGAIHYNSLRSKAAFVRVNCAALPEQLLESELFGYEKGAFTGAEKLRIGRFEQADGGTIFMDEVADMSLFTQAKILRVLQEKEFERVGSNETVKSDVRIISATNKNLVEQMEKGLFREDLYYRLNVVTIHLPPLRERDGDIKLLIRFFLKKFSIDLNKKIRGIKPDALRMLTEYHWPGNIRELENTINRAVLMADEDMITRDDLTLLFENKPVTGSPALIKLPPGGIQMEAVEKDFVLQALEMTGWVQKEAAKLLGISSRVLNYKIKGFGITYSSWKQNRIPEDESVTEI
jgi:DNA-binding NtrC family response regulator